MSAITQLHTLTPNELGDILSDVIRTEIKVLKDELQSKEPPKYLTRKQTADRLGGISLVCLHDWTRKDLLKAYKIGNRVFYKADEIEAAINESKIINHH